MSNYTITTNQIGSKITIGYWSKEHIVCNPSHQNLKILSNISLDGIKQAVAAWQKKISKQYVNEYFNDWISKKNYAGPLAIDRLLAQHPKWIDLVKHSIKNPNLSATHQIAQKWQQEYSHTPDSQIVNEECHRLPQALAILLVNFNKIHCNNSEQLVHNLLLISQINTAIGRFQKTNSLNKNSANRFLQNLPADERSLLLWLRPAIIHFTQPIHFYKCIKLLVIAAMDILICLRYHKVILLPLGLHNLQIGVGHKYLWPDTDLSTIRAQDTVRAGLYDLIVSSSINSIEDIPENLFDIYSTQHFRPGFNNRLREWLRYQNISEDKEVYPIDKLTNKSDEDTGDKWSLEWVKVNLNGPWIEFVEVWWRTHEVSQGSRLASLRPLLEWACEARAFESPWDITTPDLKNVFQPKVTNTFAHYLKKKDIENKYGAWMAAQNVFSKVCQNGKYDDSPILDIDAIHNPFDQLTPPFKPPKNKSKTTRIRIPDHILEALILKLLDLNEAGEPTFNWAKNACNDLVTVPDPENSNVLLNVWCPSRVTSLILMMIQPLRYAQIRWIDQGLMDTTIYNIATGEMIANNHPLSQFVYENGLTHYEQYGRQSGILQKFNDLFSDREDRCLFINTNKTQLWQKVRKSGYEIPWPDGKELLQSDNDLTIAQGQWLNRVYQLIEYQKLWMEKYDNNPHPISFYHVSEDKHRTNQIEDIKNNWPWFVPLFRDLDISKLLTIKIHGKNVYASPPISRVKMMSLFNKLLLAVENDYKSDGINITLTAIINGKRVNKFDPHTLRVAMISQLFDLGVPPQVIADFFSGHASHVMAAYYAMALPFKVREQFIDAAKGRDKHFGIAEVQQSIEEGKALETILTRSSRYQAHWEEFPETYAAFAPVLGGLCPKGGKGKGCLEGGLREKVGADDSITIAIGPVKGGCANCRFFLTGPQFIQEQGLVTNNIIYKIHSIMNEIIKLHNQYLNLKDQIRNTPTHQKQKLSNLQYQLQDVHSAKANNEEEVMPLFIEWVNWLELIQKSKELRQIKGDELILIGQTEITEENFTLSQRQSTMFGLVRTIIEQYRFVERPGLLIPREPANFLIECVDTILNEMNVANLLVQITDKSLRTTAASILAGFMADEFGDEKIQEAINNKHPLAITGIQNNNLLKLAEKIISQAKRGINPTINMLENTKN